MQKVAFHNLGCKVNSYEMDYMLQMLQKKGYQIVPFDENADVYIVNTCSVTNIADRKSRQILHRAKKQNPEAIVVALGCYVQTGKERALEDECIDLAIGNNKKKDIVPILEEFLRAREVNTLERRSEIIDINHTSEYEQMELSETAEHTRAYIKIQDGCNQFCSYCIIPFARGRVRSRKQEDVISEIRGLVANGYQEFVLTGIHISSYGVDFAGENYNTSESKGEALLALIREIAKLEGVLRIRLGSLEPTIVTMEFAKALSQIEQLCPHFHLSLQSGCDETLKRMNRQYTTSDYKKCVEILRTTFDQPAITTDIITGFPGESEEEFTKTVAFVKEIRFFETHIFPYSKRAGTVAAGMDGQLTEAVKKERARILIELDAEISKQYRASFIGKEQTVLLEEEKEIGKETYFAGHTERYLKVAVKAAGKELCSNMLYTGEIEGMLTDDIVLMP